MVALSTVICNKNAKIIFARQFVKMSRMELEEHIVHFSRNIDSCKDTTHLESEKARYLFIPVENLYLVLITQKSSNIIEDTEILKLIYRLFQDICGLVTESSVNQNGIELIMGIDDIVTLGYRNSVSIAQVKQYMLMDSQEEKEFKKKQEEKEQQVKKQMIEKMKEIERMKRENKYMSDSISSVNFENPIKLGNKFEISTYEPTSTVSSTTTNNETETKLKKDKKMPSKGLKLSKKKQEDEDNY
jgi:hypothetical protein